MLFPLILVTCLTMSGPNPGATTESMVPGAVQEPSKAKPAPKESPKPTRSPKPSGASRTQAPPGGSGSARPQAPRGNPGGMPRATGEPKLKRRGT